MAFLAVVTAEGGVPIFTRAVGEAEKLPFAVVGSLNGIHMFSRLREAEIKRAVTPEEKILWREYKKKIVLVLITKNDECNDCHMSNLLDNIFAAMAMLVGIDVLLKQSEMMRLQKALTITYPLVDYLLKQIDNDSFNFGDLTLTQDCLLTSDSHALQNCLKRFLDSADSLYGCLLSRGKLVVASSEWWTLTNQERMLICGYVNCLPKVLSREAVVFLPSSSPQNSNRLITLNLLRDIEVCVLCSAEPSLATLEEEAPKIWKGSFDLLKSVSNLHPRNIPSHLKLDKNMLGFLLINTKTKLSVSSMLVSENDMPSTSSQSPVPRETSKQQEALRSLYKIVIGTYFSNVDSDAERKTRADNSCPNFDYGAVDYGNGQAIEFYMCLEDNKCYVLKEKNYQLYALFNTEIPTFALQSVTKKTLKLLTEKKYFPQV